MAKDKKEIPEQIEVVTEEKTKFFITPIVRVEGYIADIDGKKISVAPEIKGQTIDPLTNSKVYGVIQSSKCFVWDLQNGRAVQDTMVQTDGYFTDLSKEQVRQLRIAGVIL